MQQWQRQAERKQQPQPSECTTAVALSDDNASPGEEDDDLRDFIVPDSSSSSDESESKEDMAEAALGPPLRLQRKANSSAGAASSSSSKKRKQKQQQASSAQEATAASAAQSAQRRLERRVSAKELFLQRQRETRLRREQRAMALPTQATSATSAEASASLTPAAAASAPAAPVASSSAASAVAAASSTTAAAPTVSSAPAAARPAAPARKRKHIASEWLDEESKESAEQRRRVESIEEFDDEPEAHFPLARSLSSADAIELIDDDDDEEQESKRQPVQRSLEAPHARNLVGHLDALRCQSVPFGSMRLARLQRLRQRRVEEAEQDPSAVAARENISSTRALHTLTPHSARFPHSSSLPSPAARLARRQELQHRSLRHIWSSVIPVRDWSLCGTITAEPINSQPTPSVSYVNSLEFDRQGGLLAASNSDARLNIYCFQGIWMDGRAVERAKRARWRREKQATLHAQAIRDRRPLSPRRARSNAHSTAAASLPSPSQVQGHEFLTPSFSMELHPNSGSPIGLRQIDSCRWNPYHRDEIAVSSQRNNTLFMSDAQRDIVVEQTLRLRHSHSFFVSLFSLSQF